ncbi:MAG: hypothetical protein P4L42_06655 [Desulfocapsaceae bacterium]|nr:hypothetical protein [Desulfocapsaceae bacterium]
MKSKRKRLDNMYLMWYILTARFFETESGRMPVKEWLLELPPEDRRIVGNEIRVAEFGWPVGMPLCRSIKGHKGL